MSRVDTTKYIADIVCPAVASKAKAMAVLIIHIMAKAGSSRETPFVKHYNKEIVQDTDPLHDAVQE